ncbi:HDR123Cp [Eremothecium sinecaudum]|uniref:HDR123Cp n=1 Tax=Eremothecium sinecaudum TaxID=45286 RepID=A0A120K2A0_9SACH|nr:HDR123Cp [Eremothecium sinecaudum]AMD20865.1 HDR123Cp [Eremothecium sinecaudum]
MTATDYTPCVHSSEVTQQGSIGNNSASLSPAEYLYSNNSLNITTQQPVEKGMQTPQQDDTPNTLKSSKTTQLGTPTAMTDLLAMLDDNTAFSDMVQQQEERHWDMDVQRGKVVPHLSSTTTSVNTTRTTDLSPDLLLQPDGPMSMASGSASAGLLEATPEKSAALLSLQQLEQQFINPNLLNSGVNSSVFVDDGFLEEPAAFTANGGRVHVGGNQVVLDEMALSPSAQRRMSEVVTGSIPLQHHPRGSISHQVDFWNLPNERQSVSSGHSASERTGNSIDLLSFRNSPTPNVTSTAGAASNTTATTLTPASNSASASITKNSSKSNSLTHTNGMAPPSVFKIDNELTQLLNDYNINFNTHTKTKSTPATRVRAGSIVAGTNAANATAGGNLLSATSATNARRSNSISEPQNRVQKQRTSTSLIDGSNPAIMDKLYGDVNKVSKFSQWENAILSDEEDHDENTGNAASQIDPKVTGAGSTFITTSMLNQDMIDNNSYELRHNNSSSTNGITVATRRKRGSIPKGPRNTTSKSSSPLDEDEKPFKCQECTKAFRRSEHLKRHIRSVHSTDRPFPCTYCDKKFSRSDNLSQHLKTHRKHGDIKDTIPITTIKKG